ncbi:pre-mRNA-splicing regulator WTAP-like [Lineus longissimus]|uniref:pre-mRNA-splicing regulator WTAP-like n=1 Tax=Lineus longissimus TaxID=88925 RepID=UPI002B4CFDCC
MTDDLPPAKRLKLSAQQLETLTREELIQRCRDQDAFLESMESKFDGTLVIELNHLKESEEKLKQQHMDVIRRESVLAMRLTTKEQEMQEYLNQIQELKQAQTNSTAQLRSMLLDPAVNIMFQRMCKELEDKKQKLEQTQNDLSAWKFTPDSQTGKRLMAKCRMLLQENDELGKVTSSGRMAKLEGDIALEKTLVQEMKKGQAEMDEFLGELDEDVEGMQSTIYILQQQLKEAREEVSRLQAETQQMHQSQQTNASLLPVNTDSATPMSGVESQDLTRTSTPASSIINQPESVQVKMEVDEDRVQNYHYNSSRENFILPTSNGQKSSPEAHNLDSAEDEDRQHRSLEHDFTTGIKSYQTSKSSNFHLVHNDHETNDEPIGNANAKVTKIPMCVESTDLPSGDDWSPKPTKNPGNTVEGEESDIAMDKEMGIDARRTGLLDRDSAVPINGLETSPSYSSHEET